MKYLTGLLLIIVLTGCQTKPAKESHPESSVFVQGKMEEGSGMKLFLSKLTEFGKEILDTILINDSYKFQFLFPVNEPGFYQLSNEVANSITLVCKPGDSLEITANYFNFREYALSGSKDLEQIEILNIKTQEFLKEISNYAKIIEDSINSPSYSSLRIEIDRKYRSSFESYKSFSRDFIYQNETSLVSLLALTNQLGEGFYVFHPVKDFELFSRVDSILFSNYPQEKAVINLHKRLLDLEVANSDQKKDSLRVGDKIPDIILPDIKGEMISIRDIEAKMILIDFWASWCTDCLENNMWLNEIYGEYHDEGFEIVQISLDNTRDRWIKEIENFDNSWIHLNDLKFWDGDAVHLLNVEQIPFKLLVNEKGIIISINPDRKKLKTELNYIFGV
jgi:thiol-disulfide isomerase/thioredoxin